MPADQKTPTQEREARVMSGWPMLAVTIVLYALCPILIYLAFVNGTTSDSGSAVPQWPLFIAGCVALGVAILLSPGFFTLQPNEARVLILFGDYRGTCKQGGFRWGNPFYANGPAGQGSGSQTQWNWGKKNSDEQAQNGPKKLKRYKVSLRARTLNGDRLKVNDKRGNPVDIAAVVVWRVEDTAKAVFDVDDFESYVAMQSETAVRHLASAYPYDSGETFADTRRTRSRCAATWTRSRRPCAWSSPSGSGRRASSWSRPASATSPTPRRSPRRCSAASRRRRSSPRAARSSPAR